VINYTTRPDWEEEVLALTGGTGADLAVDVAGPATLSKTLRATRFGGRIWLMGVPTGFGGQVDTGAILEKRITLQGIYVGPVTSLRAVVAGIEPVIDRVFPFAEADAAYQVLGAAGHVGKLLVRIGG
jgi:NADPH:quinone reductase-like Zn-dependent oxidoreductase